MTRLDRSLPGKQYGAFHEILEFTDVTGPVIGHEPFFRVFSKSELTKSVSSTKFVGEIFGQQHDVFAAVLESGKLQRNDVETVEKVLTEFPFLDRALDIPVGGGQNSDIDIDGLDTTHAVEFGFLSTRSSLA